MASIQDIRDAARMLGLTSVPDFIDRDEVAHLLETTIRDVDFMRKNHSLPALHFPKRGYLFRINDILDYKESLRHRKKSDNGYVYAISAEIFDPLCKIGFSTYASKKRLEAANIWCPYEMNLVAEYRVKEARKAESAAHKKLGTRLVRGEWYHMDEEGFALLESAISRFLLDK